MVDLSGVLQQLFSTVFSWLSSFFQLLDSIIIFSGVSLLKLIIAVVVVGLIISAVFVLFDGGDYEE